MSDRSGSANVMVLTSLKLALVSGLLCGACTDRAVSPPRVTPATVATTPDLTQAPASHKFVLSLLGLNDLHGRLTALPAFAGYVSNLRQARARDGALGLVDSGDMFQGTLESNLNEGAAVITAYEALGMNVAALGNHEFDFGPVGDVSSGDPQGAIRARINEAKFPILSANLVVRGSNDAPPWSRLQRSVVLEFGGVRVGFVGLLTRETPSIVMSAWFSGLDVVPLAPALTSEALRLRREGAELVVALAHAGADCKDFGVPEDLSSCAKDAEIFDVARALRPGTVDAIFAGHTHAGVAQIVNGVPIVEAYSRGRAFSRIDFELDRNSHRLLGTKIFPPHALCLPPAEGGQCALTPYEGQPTREDEAVARAIAPALGLAEARREVPLGCTVSEAMSCVHGTESALGNLFADMLREAVPGSDVAILNGGSLRAELPAGALNYGELFEAMPFDNLVARIRLTGGELKAVLLSHLVHDAHGVISISGVRVEARCGTNGPELKLFRKNGRAVLDTESLLLATSDYLATGGDGLLAPLSLSNDRVHINTSESFRDALARSLRHHPRLSPRDPKLFDRLRPRLVMSSPRPLVCPH